MDEFIKRKEAYKAAVEKTNNPACPTFVAANVLQSIVDIPAADVEPVRHGYWDDSFDGITPYCSVCRRTHMGINRTPSYCPNCGAKMDKEETK